jgi:NAD-dependent dihydropyrimidine dehydrogenase PreA subunit
MRRKIIRIDEDRCNGCGVCVDACAEGALEVIDGKARLVGEIYCDGIGACLSGCPTGALTIDERDAEGFDPKAVDQLLATKRPGGNGKAEHASAHGGCPGSRLQAFAPPAAAGPAEAGAAPSQLGNWPVQLHLLSPAAPYLDGADLLIAADCVAFALGSFHRDLLSGRVLAIGCPKLDDGEAYVEKLATIFAERDICSVTVAIMEVPCCRGLMAIVSRALARSGKEIPTESVRVGIRGEILETITL